MNQVTYSMVKMLDLSITHITWRDNEILQSRHELDDCFPTTVIEDEYRYIIYTWLDNPLRHIRSFNEEVRALGMSETFIRVLSYARRLGCKWVMLDRDADELPGLPTFEW